MRQPGAVGVEGIRSLHAGGGRYAPGWSPDEWESARVPRGPSDPGRARLPHPPACRHAHAKHQYSPRQRSTMRLADVQSYDRNMRRFTTGCDAE